MIQPISNNGMKKGSKINSTTVQLYPARLRSQHDTSALEPSPEGS